MLSARPSSGPVRALCAMAMFAWLSVHVRSAAAVPIDCDTADDFCTGDPCKVTTSLEITATSCVVDFGTRGLVIDGVIRVPSGGSLSLTAATIDLRRKIDGTHAAGTGSDGADIALHAAGPIDVRGKIDASGHNHSGSIAIDAGGNVYLEKLVRSRSRSHGAPTTGGTVSVQAAGLLISSPTGRVDVRGGHDTAGGQVTLSGAGGATIRGRIDARGGRGGTVSVASAAGTVSIEDDIRADGNTARGGAVSLTAGGDLRLIQPQVGIRANGRGVLGGGTIALSAVGEINMNALSARGIAGDGGSVLATARQVLLSNVSVRATGSGGLIDVTSTAADVSLLTLDARSIDSAGGQIRVVAAGNAAVGSGVRADGRTVGGDVRVDAGDGITLGLSAGETILVTAAVGGAIAAQAGGNILTFGTFSAQAGGCVGLSAGGTLNTAGASFDVPLTTTCP
jgi:hypothetical protein